MLAARAQPGNRSSVTIRRHAAASSIVGGIDVAETVGTGDALVDAVQRLRPDAVLTDIRMPPGHQMEGIEAAHVIRRDHPGVGVVVLSHHAAPAYAMELFRDGTAGLAYLLKERIGDVEEVVRALRETSAGGSVIDPRIVEALIVRRSRDEGSRLAELSPRELEVLREMARGKTKPPLPRRSSSRSRRSRSTSARSSGSSASPKSPPCTDGSPRSWLTCTARIRPGTQPAELGEVRSHGSTERLQRVAGRIARPRSATLMPPRQARRKDAMTTSPLGVLCVGGHPADAFDSAGGTSRARLRVGGGPPPAGGTAHRPVRHSRRLTRQATAHPDIR